MKKVFVFVMAIIIAYCSNGQGGVAISNLPSFTGKPAGSVVPIVVNGVTRKIDAGLLGVDTVYFIADTLVMVKNNVTRRTALSNVFERISNKSNNIITDSASTVKYPSVRAIKKYVDSVSSGSTIILPYKTYKALVSFSGSFSVIVLQNDFVGETFTYTLPSNGQVRVTNANNIFTTNKTVVNMGGWSDYFTNGRIGTSGFCIFDFIYRDGSQTSTPGFVNVLFEIQVYN